jgi:hypothetical protein
MPRPVRPWFRFYVEAFSDRKVLRLTPLQRWLWVAILGAARESPMPGYLLIAEGVPMTKIELARYADVRPKDVPPALSLMASLGMIDVSDGLVSVKNWGVRQFESDNVTARTRDYRERSNEEGKEQDKDVPTNVRRNVPETETETDKEKSMPRKRGSRLPNDWLPDPEVRTQMAEQFPQVNLKAAHEKFVDYWQAKAGRDAAKLDWNGTWRNWIRSEAERTPAGRAAANGHTPVGPPVDILGDVAAMTAWYDAQGKKAS